jgi:Peptidase M10 serralysin C terminal
MPTYPPIWTDQQIASQIARSPQHWGQTTVTYSFNNNSTPGNTLNPAFQSWVNTAIQTIEEMVNFNFVQVAGTGTVTINGSRGNGTYAEGAWNGAQEYTSGKIFFDQSWDTNQSSSLAYGSYGLLTIMHELLHGLGLDHPGDYNGTGNYFPDAVFRQDTHRYSIMSYFDADSDGSGTSHWFKKAGVWEWQYAQTPMVYDLLALTNGGFAGYFAGYSANLTTRAGATTYGYNATAGINAVYNFVSNTAPVLTIYDAGGIDTLDLSGDTVATARTLTYNTAGISTPTEVTRTTTVIDLRPGAYSSTHGMSNNIGIAFGTVIENVIGTSFNDTIVGNDAGNALLSAAGADSIYAGAGSDFLLGGAGADTLYGGSETDWFVFTSGAQDGDTVADYAYDYIYLGGSAAAPVFALSGADVIVSGVTLTGAASGIVTAVTQAATTLLSTANLAAIQSVVTGGGYALAAFGAYTYYSFDAAGSQNWRTLIQAYAANNALDFTYTAYDPGQPYFALNTDYDNAANQTWSSISTYYVAAALVDFVLVFNDAGQANSLIITDIDQASNQIWSSISTYYASASVVDFVQVNNDAGLANSVIITDFDQAANQFWTSISTYYATGSLVDFVSVINDVGQSNSAVITDFDQAANQNWSFISTYYSTASLIDFVSVSNDPGQTYSAVITDFDQANGQTWSSISTYYAPANLVDFTWVTYDAGQAISATSVDFDQNSSQTWSRIETYFSSPGVVDFLWVFYDSGQQNYATQTDYDQANLYSWSQHILEYDTPGHVINEYYI